MLLRISSRQEALRGKRGYVFILCIEEDLPKDVVWVCMVSWGQKCSVLGVEKTGLFFSGWGIHWMEWHGQHGFFILLDLWGLPSVCLLLHSRVWLFVAITI